MLKMRALLLLVASMLAMPVPLDAKDLQPLRVIVFGGGLSWPVFVAEDLGFFEKHGLAVAVTETPGSVFQMIGLYEGKFDIAMTPFDNVVAYQEGQGETRLGGTPDLFAFMGGLSSALRLIADPKVTAITDLRGRILGVDAATTGYALLMYELLDRSGLPFGSYRLEPTGGTTFRVQALEAGKISATMVSSPQEIGPEAKGYRRLGDVQKVIGAYQAVCGAARRSWASAHGESLRAYIAAYRDADAWLRDPVHRTEAVDVYLRHVKGATRPLAETALTIMLAPDEGFQPKAAFDSKGAETVLAVRSKYGMPRKALTDWQAYVDLHYYDEIAGSSGN